MKAVPPDDWSDIEKARFQKTADAIEKSITDGSMFANAVAMLVKVAGEYGECLRGNPPPTPEREAEVRQALHAVALNMHSNLLLKGMFDAKK